MCEPCLTPNCSYCIYNTATNLADDCVACAESYYLNIVGTTK